MAYDPSIFNISPYYDDFDGDKGFLRVLFKPGYAVQARELTQLQSILQNQFSKIGDHLFKDGSRIAGGGISVKNASYVMLSVDEGSPLRGLSDYSFLVGGMLSTLSGNKAKIVHFIPPDSTDGTVIVIVDFVSGSTLNQGFITFEKQNTPQITGLSIKSSVSYPTEGSCKVVSVSDGIFYVDGFFVTVRASVFSPFRSMGSYRDLSFSGFEELSKRIGFSISRDSITDSEDTTLRDPSIGSYNYNAPGADRYRLSLVLAQTDIDEDAVDFVELLRFESGKITKKIDRISYGEIQKALALRTYDESGSYAVTPFDVVAKTQENGNLSLSVGKGKAYVLGYEVDNQYPVSIPLPKAQTVQTEQSVRFPYTVGNYVSVQMGNAPSQILLPTFAGNISAINSGSCRVRFFSGTGVDVASANVHGVVPNLSGLTGTDYRLYLYGLSGSLPENAAPGFGYLYQHGTGATIGYFTSTTAITPVLSADSSLIYEIKPGYAVSEINQLSVPVKIIGNVPVQVSTTGNTTTYTFTKSNFESTIASANATAFSFFPYGNGEYSNTVDASEISLVRATDGVAYTPNNGTLTNNNQTVTLTVTNAPAGFTSGTINAIVPVLYTPNTLDTNSIRTKTPTVATAVISSSVSVSVDETGRSYFVLPYIDVYSVQSVVYTSGTPASTFDITEDFELDDGQRESHYENSRLYIKPDKVSLPRYTSSNSSVSLQVSLSYFAHGGLASAPFVGAASYINTNYETIPLYTNTKTGKTVSLANCLDFRRSGLTATTPMLKPYGRAEFGILGDTVISYRHYLPRIDKLCVKSDPEDGSALFFLIHGTPNLAPIAPPDPIDAMVVATITVPSYTHNEKSVVITPVDNKRYTMADIGKMENRVDEVEVFAKLSLSESELEAKSLKISSTDAEPLKTSIFVDEFYGHSVGDVVDSSYSCSIDYERGELRPFFTTTPVVLPPVSLINTRQSSDGIVTLQYTETPYIENKQYTTSIQINPSNTVNWLGYMTLTPSIDPFYDQSYRPVVKTNALMENDNWLSCNSNDTRGFGTQWNDWESIWTGIEQVSEEQDDIQKRIVELPRSVSVSSIPSVGSGNPIVGISRTIQSVNEKTSNYIRASRLKNRIKNKIGSRVVDRSVVPYIPSKTVVATVTGLKPNANNLVLTFDGQLLQSNLTTDPFGSCSVSFTIPENKFLAGERVVRIADSLVTENCTMAAEAVYYCTGLLQQRDAGIYSTRPAVLRRQLPSSEAIAKDPFNRDIDSVENTHWSDPICQTFFVDKKTNPNGIFVNSVSLYFASKDPTLPVAVQIRPTVSGYPSPSVVMPFATSVVLPTGITASTSLPVETKFSFSSPVYLEPGEYAVCVLANSDEYRLFAAESGFNTVSNADAVGGRAGNNQRVGTLYAPQGIGVAAEISSTDLMFTVNRCEFVTSGTAQWSAVPFLENAQLLKVYSSEIVPEPCTLNRSIDSYTFPNNETLYFNNLIGAAPEMMYQLERGSDTTVSPVIDTQSMVVAAIRLNSGNPQSASSRYVSRVVELPSEMASNGVRVLVDANVPLHSDDVITVYCRWLLSGETDIFSKSWQQTTRLTPQFTSSSEIDYKEMQFMVETGSAQRNGKFTAYQIAVELKSPSVNSPYRLVPSARNIRTVSYIK